MSGRTTPTEDERWLLQLIAQRDRAALQRLYLGYHRRLSRFVMRLVHRYDFAEEIINDTMWIVWQQAGKFRGDSQVSTWILGIAYRRALKELKRAGRAAARAEYSGDGGEPATDQAEENRRELRECIDRALARLPAEQRMAIELSYFMGHSCEEIAQIAGCPVNTVKTRMFHARLRLRALLPELLAEAPVSAARAARAANDSIGR